jgi:23S rRNA (adenine2030-N6)-methyltransferase
MQSLMRTESRDRLKLFELHPTDSRTLSANIAQLEAGRQIAVALQDGFEGLKPCCRHRHRCRDPNAPSC